MYRIIIIATLTVLLFFNTGCKRELCSAKNIESPYIYITQWSYEIPGKIGDIKIDSQDNIYILASYKGLIQKFNSDGKLLCQWQTSKSQDEKVHSLSIGISLENKIYVSDSCNNFIQVFDVEGNFIEKWTSGLSCNEFILPKITAERIARALDINISQLEPFMERKITEEEIITIIEEEGECNEMMSALIECLGMKLGSIGDIKKITIGDNGNIFISHGLDRIQIFNSEKQLLDEFIVPIMFNFNSASIADIEAVSEDSLYIVCNESIYNSRNYIYKIDSEGKFLMSLGETYNGLIGISSDSKENIFVAISYDNCIKKFDPNGKFLYQFGIEGTQAGQFNYPTDLAVDSKGNIYVIDSKNYRIQKFAPNPNFKVEKLKKEE